MFFWEGLASYLNRKTGGLAQRPFLSAASGSLPLAELSSLHAKFGGDDSATRAETWKTHGTPEGICLCGGSLVDGSEIQISNLNEYVYIYIISIKMGASPCQLVNKISESSAEWSRFRFRAKREVEH